MSATYPLPKGTRQVTPDYISDGVILAFAIPFRFFDPTDIWVGFGQSIAGPFLPKVLGVDYTITGSGAPAGGSVNFTVAPLAGLVRVMGLRTPSRLASAVNGGALQALALENELDVQEMTLQELRRDMNALQGQLLLTAVAPPRAYLCSMVQWRAALALVNAPPDTGLLLVDQSIPADINNPTAISWASATGVAQNDLVWTQTATVLGFNGAQMLALLAAAQGINQ